MQSRPPALLLLAVLCRRRRSPAAAARATWSRRPSRGRRQAPTAVSRFAYRDGVPARRGRAAGRDRRRGRHARLRLRGERDARARFAPSGPRSPASVRCSATPSRPTATSPCSACSPRGAGMRHGLGRRDPPRAGGRACRRGDRVRRRRQDRRRDPPWPGDRLPQLNVESVPELRRLDEWRGAWAARRRWRCASTPTWRPAPTTRSPPAGRATIRHRLYRGRRGLSAGGRAAGVAAGRPAPAYRLADHRARLVRRAYRAGPTCSARCGRPASRCAGSTSAAASACATRRAAGRSAGTAALVDAADGRSGRDDLRARPLLVAEAGVLLARVIYLKETAHALRDPRCRHEPLMRPALYGAHARVLPVREPARTSRCATDVVGPICESTDVLARGRSCRRWRRGDLVAFMAGAYGAVMASNYNSCPSAAEVLVDGAGRR